jgi:hypothetical protein
VKFDPKIKSRDPLPPGAYAFEVLKAEETTSKNGNDMIKLSLQVMGPEYDVYVNDWLLQKVLHRLMHFCETAGLEEQFVAGNLTADDCQGATGRVILEIEDKPGFSPKNKVKDYEGKPPGDQVIKRKVIHASAGIVAPTDETPF